MYIVPYMDRRTIDTSLIPTLACLFDITEEAALLIKKYPGSKISVVFFFQTSYYHTDLYEPHFILKLKRAPDYEKAAIKNHYWFRDIVFERLPF